MAYEEGRCIGWGLAIVYYFFFLLFTESKTRLAIEALKLLISTYKRLLQKVCP